MTPSPLRERARVEVQKGGADRIFPCGDFRRLYVYYGCHCCSASNKEAL